MNVGYLLSNSANKFPERLAIISDEGRWTYRAFDERTNRLAGAMLDAGLKKGDRIAILLFNTIWAREDKTGERAIIDEDHKSLPPGAVGERTHHR